MGRQFLPQIELFGSRLLCPDIRAAAPNMALATPTVALIIKQEWASKILNGEKTLELRSTACKKREPVAVAISGTKQLWGQVNITDRFLICRKIDGELKDVAPHSFQGTMHLHLVNNPELVKDYEEVHGWLLSGAVRYDRPIPYHHKRGAVVWVDLTKPEKPKKPRKTANNKRVNKKPVNKKPAIRR